MKDVVLLETFTKGTFTDWTLVDFNFVQYRHILASDKLPVQPFVLQCAALGQSGFLLLCFGFSGLGQDCSMPSGSCSSLCL